jgi:hypothetical protein
MQRRVVPLALLAALAPAGAAHADRLAAARAQPLVEVSHTVDVEVKGGVAVYKVRRAFANAGERSEEASLRIDLAHGAAVTGLRIRARDRWYDGELMEAEAAREKYRELTGLGAWEPRDPALLQWVWADEAHLQVFPVLPGGVNTVEYTLTAPLEYHAGRYVISYPRAAAGPADGSLPLAPPVLRVRPGHGDARTRVTVAGQRVAPDTPVVLAPPPPLAWIGDGEPHPGHGYVFSRVDVARDEPVTRAEVALEIDHTFSGDLSVHLVTPGGERLHVVDGNGGENDLRGRFTVDLPDGARSAGAWHLAVADQAGLDLGTLDAWSLQLEPALAGAAKLSAAAADLPRFIPDATDGDGDGGHALIEVEPPPIATLAARVGRVVASEAHGFSRLEIDAAPQLRPLPRGASVVFVLDVSRSMPESARAAQLRVAHAYLSHVPDARAEVVVFDRRARRVFGEFVGAREFAARLADAAAAGALAGGNGSALELGLGAAADALHGRRGPTRVVALGDAELRTRFRPELADRALAGAPSAVLHLVVPEEDDAAWLRRDDAHALAPLAARHRGVLFAASAPDGDKSLAAEMLGLVRPVAIDHFRVRGIDLTGAAELPASLREGAGYRAMLAADDPTRQVTITGKLWATPLRRVVRHDPGFDAATAAFVFSEDEHQDLSKAEMLTVAFQGRAVSPVTSYLATEPGVRPAVDGLEDGDRLGTGGAGLVGRGYGVGGRAVTRPPRLRDLLADAVDRCAAGLEPDWHITLELETTRIEIVDVQATRASSPALRDCVVEAAWDLQLPEADWPQREQHTLSWS